jgi:hypothetical protein
METLKETYRFEGRDGKIYDLELTFLPDRLIAVCNGSTAVFPVPAPAPNGDIMSPLKSTVDRQETRKISGF